MAIFRFAKFIRICIGKSWSSTLKAHKNELTMHRSQNLAQIRVIDRNLKSQNLAPLRGAKKKLFSKNRGGGHIDPPPGEIGLIRWPLFCQNHSVRQL